jgi:hypothetical protein
MSQYTDKLTTLMKEAPDTVSNIEGSIAQIEVQVDDLTKERDAIQNGVCGNAETEATDYLENTVAPAEGGYMYYGPNYGAIDYDDGGITDWEVRDATTHLPIYTYTPGDYPDLDELVDDFAFGNDYITRPLTTGATYGLNPNISSLNDATAMLNENADKVADSVAVFNKYAT